ncbi:hypothetical protein ATY81_25430 [Rhizobium sp. R72]|uniref:hypothetical protein n=1 Tax=unclassified Rhizobium TaxID=2613769 RepID=UPI000B531CE1|nr:MULTISPECIES: hypothetical protein [unclassified Rhizobium]OWW00137.1 hypothetical protein ATY81_25430 [Rhizobium sp. R72]OWW00528.1 hypothetical protein ATY80_25430 [Rhizobium sp. R711]
MSYLVEVLVPFNRTQEQAAVLAKIKSDLTEKFGAVRLHLYSPAEELWSDSRTGMADDTLVIEVMTALVDRAWWTSYKYQLQLSLQKKGEVVVRTSFIERI